MRGVPGWQLTRCIVIFLATFCYFCERTLKCERTLPKFVEVPPKVWRINKSEKRKKQKQRFATRSDDPEWATITSLFSEDSPRAPALDHELPDDLPGFLSGSRAKVASGLLLIRSLFFLPKTTTMICFRLLTT